MPTIALVVGSLVGSIVDLNQPGHYIHWGWIQMSYANLLVIVLMIVVFLAAILIPFKTHRSKGEDR
jgi:hypothetical protein